MGKLINQTLLAGAYVSLAVSDNGHGISSETLEKIFEPFYSTKGMAGRGLGLAAILGIVRGHKGGVTVDSIVGDGTTFTFLFPASNI